MLKPVKTRIMNNFEYVIECTNVFDKDGKQVWPKTEWDFWCSCDNLEEANEMRIDLCRKHNDKYFRMNVYET